MNRTMMPDVPHAVTARVAPAIPSERSLRLLAAVAAGATSGDSLTAELYDRPTTTLSAHPGPLASCPPPYTHPHSWAWRWNTLLGRNITIDVLD